MVLSIYHYAFCTFTVHHTITLYIYICIESKHSSVIVLNYKWNCVFFIQCLILSIVSWGRSEMLHFLCQSKSKNNEYLSIFLYLCFGRKLTQKTCFAPLCTPQCDSEHTWRIYPQTQSNFWLFLDRLQLLTWKLCVERISLSWCQPDLFFLSALELGQCSAQPKPHGALTNLSSPSVFHAAWGTLAGSPNELALLPPRPPPVIVSSPCATCLSHRDLPMPVGCMDFSSHQDCRMFFTVMFSSFGEHVHRNVPDTLVSIPALNLCCLFYSFYFSTLISEKDMETLSICCSY